MIDTANKFPQAFERIPVIRDLFLMNLPNACALRSTARTDIFREALSQSDFPYTSVSDEFVRHALIMDFQE